MVYNRKPEGEQILVTATKEPQPPQEPRTVLVETWTEPQEPRIIPVITTGDRPASSTTGPAPGHDPAPGATAVWSWKKDQDTDATTEPAPQISAAPTVKRSDFARAFYTVPQAAEVLQVHENTIYNLVRAGKVEHYKVGAQIRIARAELERLKVERKA